MGLSNTNLLRHAAALGDADAVRRLMQNGADIAEMDNAPMRWALRHQRASIVKLLLDAGARMADNLPEFLRITAKNGDVESLQQLLHLKLPLPPHSLDQVLYDAINANQAGSVRLLLRAGANPEAGNHKPVMLASSSGNVEILETLQKYGADLCPLESQSLVNAVLSEDKPSVKLILRAGADPNTGLGSALILAISNGDAEMVEILLGAGAKLSAPSFMDHCVTSDSIETLLLLADHEYPYAPYGDEIAKSAAEYSAVRVLQFILNQSIVSPSGCNEALINAARKPSEPILELLIQHGADAGANQSAALSTAITAGHFSHAHKLLAANAQGADVNAKSLLRVTNAGEWPLLVKLLQGGAPVAGLTLAKETAMELFNHVAPPDMLHDSGGNALSAPLCDERKTFVFATAKIAVAAMPEQKVSVTLWLTEFLSQHQSVK